MKSLEKDITSKIIVGYATEEIVEFVFQLALTGISTATLGVQVPPQAPNLLKKVAK